MITDQQSIPDSFSFAGIYGKGISQNKTGREKCLERLIDVYNKGGSERLILISGESGAGKTSLALKLQTRIIRDDGCMLLGKFDQIPGDCQTTTTIFGPFVEAFTQSIESAASNEADKLRSLRETIEAALDLSERQVLRDLIPAVGDILRVGSQPDNCVSGEMRSVIKGPDAETRFVKILGVFLTALCCHKGPLVLFLDDLQWASPSALKLLTSFVRLANEQPELGLTVVCSCQNDETLLATNAFIVGFRALCRQDGVKIDEIQVSNLSEDEVCSITSEVLHLQIADGRPLSKALHRQTNGKLLFLVMMLETICEEGILLEVVGDPSKLSSLLPYHKVTQLILRKLRKLSDHAIGLLKVASFLGSTFPIQLLSHLGFEINEVISKQLDCFLTFDARSGKARFVHDRIQASAYTLVPEIERAAMHLRIGRQLWDSMLQEKRDEHLFLIAHQLSRGVDHVGVPLDRNEIAEIFFLAGQKAASSSAFTTAATYLNMGISLLTPGHWTNRYGFSLRLYNLTAEVEYYNGNLKRVDELVQTVLKRARTLNDKLQAHFTRIYSLGSRNDFRRAMDESMDLLECLGERFPRNPTLLHVYFGLVRGNRLLRGLTDEVIHNLPVLKDQMRLAAMRLMVMTLFFAFHLKERVFSLLAVRLVWRTLEEGRSDMACCGFASLSVVQAMQGRVDEACRVGEFALRLMNCNSSNEWQARVVGAVHGIVFPLKRPFRDSHQALIDAHKCGLVVGDVYFSLICASRHCRLSLAAGQRLSSIVTEIKKHVALSEEHCQCFALYALHRQLQFCLDMIGPSADNPLEVVGEEEALKSVHDNDLFSFTVHHVFKLMMAVYMNDLELAQDVCCRFRKIRKVKIDALNHMDYLFFESLTSVIGSPTSKLRKKRAQRMVAEVKKHAQQAPSNYLHRLFLLEAEIASNNSKFDQAMVNYRRSIEHAGKEGLIHEQALACERAAYALHRSRRFSDSLNFLVQARSLYQEWGATAKVQQLSLSIDDWIDREGGW